jgi:hypothetical protein
MTTYLTPNLTLDDRPVRTADLWFFRRAVRCALFQVVRREFSRLESAGKLNRKRLAHRLGKKNASVITRWFTAPSNWRVDTYADLMVGMGIDPRGPLAVFVADQKRQEEALAAIAKLGKGAPKQTVTLPIPDGRVVPLRIVEARPSTQTRGGPPEQPRTVATDVMHALEEAAPENQAATA